jgi:hypothetical protein
MPTPAYAMPCVPTRRSIVSTSRTFDGESPCHSVRQRSPSPGSGNACCSCQAGASVDWRQPYPAPDAPTSRSAFSRSRFQISDGFSRYHGARQGFCSRSHSRISDGFSPYHGARQGFCSRFRSRSHSRISDGFSPYHGARQGSKDVIFSMILVSCWQVMKRRSDRSADALRRGGHRMVPRRALCSQRDRKVGGRQVAQVRVA